MPSRLPSMLSGILETPTFWLQLEPDAAKGRDGPTTRPARLDGAEALDVTATVPTTLPPLSARLQQAFDEGAFSVVYQPLIESASGVISGVEALLRWSDPLGEVHSPSDFVPVLERSGLIGAVGEWVLREACTRIGPLSAAGGPLTLSVNLSPCQFAEHGLVERIARILSECSFAPARLEVEITESMIEDLAHARATILALQELGVRVLIDDFGIGYSSLNHLKRLPVWGLKLDRSFVAGMLTQRHDRVITESVVQLAHELELNVVAEGVEDRAHERWLRTRGVQRLQGFLFSAGVAPARLGALLHEQPFVRSSRRRAPAAQAPGRRRRA